MFELFSLMTHVEFWFAFLVLAFAVVGLYAGFGQYKTHAVVRNLRTTQVRSAAPGLVQLKGKAIPAKTLVGPLSQTPCAYYEYEIEAFQQKGKRSRWVTLEREKSGNIAFLLEDETGRVKVCPKGSYCSVSARYFLTSDIKSAPAHLAELLQRRGYCDEASAATEFRFTESHIAEGDELYVVGVHQQSVRPGDSGPEMVIASGDTRHEPFYISDRDQNPLLEKLMHEFMLYTAVSSVLILCSIGFINSMRDAETPRRQTIAASNHR